MHKVFFSAEILIHWAILPPGTSWSTLDYLYSVYYFFFFRSLVPLFPGCCVGLRRLPTVRAARLSSAEPLWIIRGREVHLVPRGEANHRRADREMQKSQFTLKEKNERDPEVWSERWERQMPWNFVNRSDWATCVSHVRQLCLTYLCSTHLHPPQPSL